MKRLFMIFLAGFSFIANAANDLSLDVSPEQGSFVVTLDANPTTGYQWSLIKFDNKLVTLSTSNYQKLQTKRIGAGGKMLFTFTLNKGKTYPKQTTLVFNYARSWEAGSGTTKKVVVNFLKK